ncbi:MAG: hypothetical protein U1E29_01825 [Coriobacteriia bacterium]|nr:hypothetical protein [Coriobacteriia bacterium]
MTGDFESDVTGGPLSRLVQRARCVCDLPATGTDEVVVVAVRGASNVEGCTVAVAHTGKEPGTLHRGNGAIHGRQAD